MLKKGKSGVLLVSGLCCLAVLGGCGSVSGDFAAKDAQKEADAEVTESADMADDAVKDGQTGTGDVKGDNLGDFSMQDIEGETYTQEMFADYDLTMVNVFTTWCTPCVNEIPDLEKLGNEMEEEGVQVVGIVLDCADEETVEKAKLLAEKTGATYPFLVPDEGYLNGRLAGINAVPETFFVDKEGNIVGESYTGSRSFEDWKSIVEDKLKGAGL